MSCRFNHNRFALGIPGINVKLVCRVASIISIKSSGSRMGRACRVASIKICLLSSRGASLISTLELCVSSRFVELRRSHTFCFVGRAGRASLISMFSRRVRSTTFRSSCHLVAQVYLPFASSSRAGRALLSFFSCAANQPNSRCSAQLSLSYVMSLARGY